MSYILTRSEDRLIESLSVHFEAWACKVGYVLDAFVTDTAKGRAAQPVDELAAEPGIPVRSDTREFEA